MSDDRVGRSRVAGDGRALRGHFGGPVFAQETPPARRRSPSTPTTAVRSPAHCGRAGSFNGAPYSGQVKKISAPDDKTVVFELCSPDPAFLAKIAFISFAINDADYLIANAAEPAFLETINGTGPYKLDEWRRGRR